MQTVMTPEPRCNRWQPPIQGWVKLNTDGAVSVVAGKSGCGGVVRNYMGLWISGFAQNLGVCEVYDEEWGLLFGLGLTWDEGY